MTIKPFSSLDYDNYGVRHSTSFNTPDFNLDQIEAEMDAMTQEMTTEEIAAMEKEIADGLGQSFDEIFGG